jgi:D-amino peptidase
MSISVYISVDLEGISGVFSRDEIMREGELYSLACKRMAEDVNAAIEGALSAGADRIYVKDAHWRGFNINPQDLREEAILVRGWGPLMSMVDGIDEGFDALIFVGYHSKSGTEEGILSHTYTGIVKELKVNGIAIGEAGLNALIAGYFNVPPVFISGDEAVTREARELFGDIETVSVKWGWTRNSGKALSPQVARRKIKEGVERALKSIERFNPFRLKNPLKVDLTLSEPKMAQLASFIPGVNKNGCGVSYTAENPIELWKIFNVIVSASWSVK